MMQKIQTLLNDIYEEQNAKQKMEIRLLQSQINPHFLYNTLRRLRNATTPHKYGIFCYLKTNNSSLDMV